MTNAVPMRVAIAGEALIDFISEAEVDSTHAWAELFTTWHVLCRAKAWERCISIRFQVTNLGKR